MLNKLKEKIEAEIQKLDRLFQESEPLLILCKQKEPDFIEISAVALCLHSFYNGIENILSLIAKNVDKDKIQDGHWHKTLFNNAFLDTANRKRIFRAELQEPLGKYLTFRHFIRHSYDYEIEWNLLKPLIDGIETAWEQAKEDLFIFIQKTCK